MLFRVKIIQGVEISAKIRSNLYLEKDLKEQAKEFFKSYGLSLSGGINLILRDFLQRRKINFFIEKIRPEEPDYQILAKAEKEYNNNKDDYVDFEDINWN